MSTNHKTSEPKILSEINLEGWPSFEHRNYGNDVAVLGFGTPSNIIRHLIEARTSRRVQVNGIHQVRGAASSPADLQHLRAAASERYLSFSKGSKPERVVYHPHSPIIAHHELGRGHVTGLSSDFEYATQLIVERPLIKKDLDTVAEEFVRACHIHRLTSCKLVAVGAFGGHDPWLRYELARIATKIQVATLINLKILPSAAEPLSIANAQGEIYRQLADGLPSNGLNFLVANHHRGAHRNDDALMDGIAGIMGMPENGQDLDNSSLVRTMLVNGCGWVEAVPDSVLVPCGRASELYRRPPVEIPYAVKLPSSVGGRTADLLLDRAKDLISRAPGALHVLVMTAWITDEEITEVKESIVYLNPGHVVPVINKMHNPTLVGHMARATVCDFVVSQEVPPMVTNLFGIRRQTFTRDGMTPQEFVKQVRPPESYQKARDVQKLIDQLIEG